PANRPSGIKRLADWFKECVLEQIPGAKPTWQFLKREGGGVKNGWVLFTAIAVLVILATHFVDSKIFLRVEPARQNQLNDLIVSAIVTVIVDVPQDETVTMHIMGAGAEIILGRDNKVLLSAETAEAHEEPAGERTERYRLVTSVPNDSPDMGQ